MAMALRPHCCHTILDNAHTGTGRPVTTARYQKSHTAPVIRTRKKASDSSSIVSPYQLAYLGSSMASAHQLSHADEEYGSLFAVLQGHSLSTGE